MTQIRQIIAYIDIAPTLLNIAGSKYNADFDRMDIWESNKGNKLPERYVFLGNTGIVS